MREEWENEEQGKGREGNGKRRRERKKRTGGKGREEKGGSNLKPPPLSNSGYATAHWDGDRSPPKPWPCTSVLEVLRTPLILMIISFLTKLRLIR